MHEIRNILVRMRLGDSDRALAKARLIGRAKAKKLRTLAQTHGWLETGSPLPDDSVLTELVATAKPDASNQTPTTASCVEPFRALVQQWVDQGVQSKAIYLALQRNHQFSGSYSSVYRFVCSIRPKELKVTSHMTFSPGEAAQVDFGSGPTLEDPVTGKPIKTWFFLMTLCWSRHQYAELVFDQKVETWLAAHQHAFDWFGGVVKRVIIDNAKCAITKACARDPQVQRSYAECAEAYGFKIDACAPRDPQKKGRVESGINYLKRNFLPLRTIRDRSDANRQLQEWILGEAGNRVHGSTYEKPLVRFAIEKYLLLPLPVRPPEPGVWTRVKVHRDAHVQFEKCLYSVPYTLLGLTLWLKAVPATVRIFREHELIALHPRQSHPGQRSTIEDHMPPEAIAWKMRDPQWCLKQSQRIGTACHHLVRHLFADRVLHNLRAVQGICGLEKKYGAKRLEAACQRALDYSNPRYATVKTILEKGLDQHGNVQLAFDNLAESYTGDGRFCRNPNDLLKH